MNDNNEKQNNNPPDELINEEPVSSDEGEDIHSTGETDIEQEEEKPDEGEDINSPGETDIEEEEKEETPDEEEVKEEKKEAELLKEVPEKPSFKVSPYLETTAVIIFLGIILFIRFRPLFSQLNNMVFWSLGDELYFWHWRYWVSKQFFQTFLNAEPFSLWNFIYYGILANSGFPEAGNVFDLIFISLPLNNLFPYPMFYSIKIMLILIFNSWAGYYVIKRLTGNYGSAIICSLFILLNPYIFFMINKSRLRAALLGFMILCIFYLYRTSVDFKWKDTLLSGIFLVLTSVIYWFYGIFLIWTIILLLIGKGILLYREKKKREIKTLLVRIAVIIGIFAISALFFFLPYETGTISLNYPDLKFFIPFPSLDKALSETSAQFNEYGFPWVTARLILSDSIVVTFHFSLIICLAAIFAFKGKRKLSFFFLVLFIIFLLLSYGPYLKASESRDIGEFARIAGHPIPMPYKFLFHYLPPISRLQHPDRFLSVSAIALMFLAGMGITQIYNYMNKREMISRYVVFIILAGPLLFNLPAMRTEKTIPMICELRIPKIYREMAKQDYIYGVIEVPWEENIDRLNFYQTFHNKRFYNSWCTNMLGGFEILPQGKLYEICRPDEHMESNKFIEYLKKSPKGEEINFTEKDIRELSLSGYRYVILHEWDFPSSRTENEPHPKSRKDSYLKVKNRLEEMLGKPEEQWEVKLVFDGRGIPTSVRMVPYKISVFKLEK